MKPLIDVCVVACDHPWGWVEKCVKSILDQDFSRETFIWLYKDPPNNPNDPRQRRRRRIYTPPRRVVTEDGDKNRGASAARNHAASSGTPFPFPKTLSYSAAPWIMFLDGDDWLGDGCLAELRRVAEKSDADVIYPSIISHIEPGHRQHSWPGQPKKFSLKKLINFNYIPVTALMKREWFEKVGGFDENMKDGFEDWELWLRMALAGAKFQFAPDAYLMYRQHDGGRSIEAGKKVEEIATYIHKKHKDECAAWMNLHNKG